MTFRRFITRYFIDMAKTVKLCKGYSLFPIHKESLPKTIVAMYDGKLTHGGLSDRLWGLLSVYKYCKDNGILFKLNFRHPYELRKFLRPNKVDWVITENELSYNFWSSRPEYVSLFYDNLEDNISHFNKRLASIRRQQIHIYTNTRIFTFNEFKDLFNELFCPSEALKKAVDYHKDRIGSDYIAVTFRFQQLLGDFKEGSFHKLATKDERESLIAKCLSVVKSLRDKKGMPILVTSESVTFLNRVSQLENVYVIPGKLAHIDYDDGDGDDVHLKSFIDMYMLAGAKEVNLCYFPPLYRSGFPYTCAAISGTEYREIIL